MHIEELQRVLSTFVLFPLCLHACSAKNLTCTVSLDDGRLVYNISEGSYASNAADCAFSWTNGTGHVLAHAMGKAAELVMCTINALVSSKCYDRMTLTRNCDSEGIEHSATCTTDCISIEKQEHERFLRAVVIPLVAGVLGGIFLCGIVLCLCYIFRKKIKKVLSGGDFSAVEMQDAGNP